MHKKKSRTKKIVSSFFIIITFLLGIIIGKLIDWPFFEVDKNINLVEIFSLIITLLIGYFIAKVIDKEKTDDREEKNLIISNLNSVSQLVDDLSEKVETKKILYIEVTSKLKRMSIKVSSVFDALELTSISIADEARQNIFYRLKKIKNLLTNTPIFEEQAKKSLDLPLIVQKGVINISDSRVIEIECEFEKLKNLIFILQMRINSY